MICGVRLLQLQKVWISSYSLKRLPNHKNSNDATAGYLVIDVERLRNPMQQVTDVLLKYMGVKKSS